MKPEEQAEIQARHDWDKGHTVHLGMVHKDRAALLAEVERLQAELNRWKWLAETYKSTIDADCAYSREKRAEVERLQARLTEACWKADLLSKGSGI